MSADIFSEAQAVRASADCLHDAAAVALVYDRLAADLEREYQGKNPLVLCTLLGGIMPCAELLRRVNFPFELDYLHATRYRKQTTGAGLVWKAYPATPLQGRHVLLVDDILDEGHTLKAMQEYLAQQQPQSLRTVVLAEKIHARKAPDVQAEFIGLQVEDRYVFGCGMDYKGYWRQLPGIWAVKS